MIELKDKVISEIKKIYDPEIPVNIYELGLIYKLEINDKNVLKNNCTFIEIKHYEKDKLLKTETYPLTHFLEGFENEFKRVRYN